jgi:hypothetical protein
LIINGTPIDKVALSTFTKVQERLEELGKVGGGVNMWGCKRKVG